MSQSRRIYIYSREVPEYLQPRNSPLEFGTQLQRYSEVISQRTLRRHTTNKVIKNTLQSSSAMPVTTMPAEFFRRDKYGRPVSMGNLPVNSISRSPSQRYRDIMANRSSKSTTKTVPKGFKDLPGEVRNEIYKYWLATSEQLRNHVVEARNVLRSKRSPDQQFNFALELARSYRFLLISKAIMQENLQICLGACTLHFDFAKNDDVKLSEVFQKASSHAPLLQCTKYIRLVSILLSKPPTSTTWLSQLQLLCPNLSTLEVQLLNHTNDTWQHVMAHFRQDEVLASWSTLREIRVRHVELEWEVRRQQRIYAFENPFTPVRAVSGGVPAPWSSAHLWQLDMEVRFFEQVNAVFARLLWVHRRGEAKQDEENGEGGDDA